MTAPRFVLVKHVPDLHRFEPKNIGVIVWAPGVVAARFLAEINDLGDVDGRSVPAFVSSLSAYKQWVRFWRGHLAAEQLEPIVGGARVSKTDPGYVTALFEASSSDFVVSEGGVLLDEVTPDNINDVVAELYDRLVRPAAASGLAPAVVDEPRDPALDDICDELIAQAQLATDPNFRTGFVVECPIDQTGNLVESFEFSHAYKNGVIKKLYQRVPLPRQRKTLRKTVHDSAWMFEKVAMGRIATREQCACLVFANDERQHEPEVQQSLRVLSSVARIVNVANRATALDEFRRIGDAQ